MPTWEAFVAVALDELIPLTTSSIHVRHRVRRLLEQLAEQAPPDRATVLKARLADLRIASGTRATA